MPMDNPGAYTKNGGGAVMLAAKGRMAEMLKKMMAAKLKAKLGLGEEEEESKSGEVEMSDEESKSGENELPEGELRQLLEMYSKLK